MARRGRPAEFRRRIVELVEGGWKLADASVEFDVSQQTIYTWRRSIRFDAGLEASVPNSDQTELSIAKRRIRELETELPIHRRATELLRKPSSPKGRTRRSRYSPPRASRSRSLNGSGRLGVWVL